MDFTLLQPDDTDDWEGQSTNDMVAMTCKRDRVEEDMDDDWIYLNILELTVVLRKQGCGDGGGDGGSSGDDGGGRRWCC